MGDFSAERASVSKPFNHGFLSRICRLPAEVIVLSEVVAPR